MYGQLILIKFRTHYLVVVNISSNAPSQGQGAAKEVTCANQSRVSGEFKMIPLNWL